MLFAERTYVNSPDGRRIDLGYVGDVNWVNARLLELLVKADAIPCIATIARDQAGGKLNVNADTAAGAVAAAMKADSWSSSATPTASTATSKTRPRRSAT